MKIDWLNCLRLYSYPKTSAIRLAKNISLLLATCLVVITLIILSHTAKKETKVDHPPASVGSHDTKVQIDQAKKNSILRRFISYYEVPKVVY